MTRRNKARASVSGVAPLRSRFGSSIGFIWSSPVLKKERQADAELGRKASQYAPPYSWRERLRVDDVIFRQRVYRNVAVFGQIHLNTESCEHLQDMIAAHVRWVIVQCYITTSGCKVSGTMKVL